MDDKYLSRARAALAAFETAVEGFDAGLAAIATAADLPAKQVRSLSDIVERLRGAAKRLEHSLEQIAGDTALDVVDLQVRLENETASLAAPLKALGEIFSGVKKDLGAAAAPLLELDERAGRVAAAFFPNTVRGAREINRTLWEFRPLWNEYARILATELAKPPGKGLKADQIARVEQTALGVRARFDDVNELLNQLVTGTAEGAPVDSLIRQARKALGAAVREARSKAADAYKPFHSVLKQAESLAQDIDKKFDALRVPVFPPAASLGELSALVDSAHYEELAGVERFALFNICARLKSVALADGTGDLLGRFSIQVFDVFPDRVYFTADASFIDAVRALQARQLFEEAPASLHKFKDGSFKQRQSRKGMLQVSYAFGTNEQPGDKTKVRVDADIDLYRSPLRHLFGEVLVNHLTGGKTDQFAVWDILASSQVTPVAAFEVVSVGELA